MIYKNKVLVVYFHVGYINRDLHNLILPNGESCFFVGGTVKEFSFFCEAVWSNEIGRAFAFTKKKKKSDVIGLYYTRGTGVPKAQNMKLQRVACLDNFFRRKTYAPVHVWLS